MDKKKFHNVFSVLFLSLALISFGLGFHEIDLAFNMNRNAFDKAMDGTIRSTYEVWSRGLKFLFLSQMFWVVSYMLYISS